MLCLYIYTLAQRFDISDQERTKSIRRAEIARILSSTQEHLSLLLTPADPESAPWRHRSVRTVRGIPWSIREHVFHHAYSGTPWKTAFVDDRLARNTKVEKQQRRSVFVTACEDKFVNTSACWYRKDRFAQVTRSILELICTFLHQQDILHMIDSSRSLADACCHWIRRVHTRDPPRTGIRRKYSTICICGNPSALACVQERCGTCCDDDSGCRRHGRSKRLRVR